MSQDAIISELSIRFRRFLLFVTIMSIAWFGLWSVPLIRYFDVSWKTLLEITAYVASEPSNGLFAFWFWSAGALALLGTMTLFLLVGSWWTGRGDIYRRGARMIDHRTRRH